MKTTPRPPNITRAVRAVVQDVARRLEDFAHLKASRILVLAGEARRRSWATIRPLAPKGDSERPVVRIKGRQMLYVITLRPRFFRVATPEKRVETILHELFHISKRFDGTLHRGRLHAKLGERFERRLDPIVRAYLEQMPGELYEALAWNGVAMARQWLERPSSRPRPDGRGRRVYTEKQLFVGPVEMITRARDRKKRRRVRPPQPPLG